MILLIMLYLHYVLIKFNSSSTRYHLINTVIHLVSSLSLGMLTLRCLTPCKLVAVLVSYGSGAGLPLHILYNLGSEFIR